MCDSDQLTVDQLTSTTNQLRALNHMVELLHTHTHTHQVHTLTHIRLCYVMLYFMFYVYNPYRGNSSPSSISEAEPDG